MTAEIQLARATRLLCIGDLTGAHGAVETALDSVSIERHGTGACRVIKENASLIRGIIRRYRLRGES